MCGVVCCELRAARPSRLATRSPCPIPGCGKVYQWVRGLQRQVRDRHGPPHVPVEPAVSTTPAPTSPSKSTRPVREMDLVEVEVGLAVD